MTDKPVVDLEIGISTFLVGIDESGDGRAHQPYRTNTSGGRGNCVSRSSWS